MRRTTMEILLRILFVTLLAALVSVGLIIWMVSQALAQTTTTTTTPVTNPVRDPLALLPDDCTAPSSWILHADMLAAMKAQNHGAVVVQSGALADGTKLELYYDTTSKTWFNTLVVRSPTMIGWSTKKTSPTCLFAYGDAVQLPVVPVGVIPK